MLVWIIVILVILLILACPVGIDAAYESDSYYVKLKLSLFRKTLLPGKKKEIKEKSPEKPQEEKKEEEQNKKEKKKLKLTFDDFLTLAEIGLNALRRFRMHLSVDRFRLSYVAAASDPYKAVLQYGKVNAALGAVVSKAHNLLKVRDEDIRTELDLSAEKPSVSAGILLSIQIWEILLIALCAGASGALWFLKKKRKERAAAAASIERSKEDGEL